MSDMSMEKNTKKLGVGAIVLMIFSVIFGIGNTAVAFFKMGYASIIWYVFGGLTFFLPLMFISAEFASSFKDDSSGGIYTWMRRSRGELYGFLGTFMFYFSMFIWLVGVSTRIWVPISSFLFGEDKTQSWSLFGLEGTQTLGILGIILMLVITFLASRGFNKVSLIAKISGISCTIINILLYVLSFTVLLMNKGFFEEKIEGLTTFVNSPSPDHTPITLFAFVTFAIFAYGGIESLGSFVDKAKSANTFSKACFLGTIFIIGGYCLGIFCWGISTSYDQTHIPGIHMGNVTYMLMRNLGYKLGIGFGMSPDSALALGQFFMRVVGLSMLLGFFGAVVTLIYAPLKTLIDGSPKHMWPEIFYEKNKFDMPQKALWIQATAICVMVGIMSFFGKAMGMFFEVLQLLSNVGQCIPYVFIIASFPAFRKNDSFNHDYTLFKTKKSAIFVSTLSYIVVSLGTIFTIFEPILTNAEGAVFKTSSMIISPAIFFIIAFLVFNSYKKRTANLENTVD